MVMSLRSEPDTTDRPQSPIRRLISLIDSPSRNRIRLILPNMFMVIIS